MEGEKAGGDSEGGSESEEDFSAGCQGSVRKEEKVDLHDWRDQSQVSVDRLQKLSD